ncbi:hypothetical protein ACFW9L_07565 [Streptomyces sp. NPDC059517]|uniref:hypothetical protein n=1 Tax=Streptomyces sp. NPDC059517 TaxID=3346855 RepID=UPI0036992865
MIVDTAAACQGGKPFSTGSAPYEGPGPHEALGFQLSDYDQEKYIAPDPPGLFPDAWASNVEGTREVFHPSPEPADYEQAQLAVCMSGPRVTEKRAGVCSYGETFSLVGTNDIGMVTARYEFKVFEARTGKLLKAFTMDGADFCPKKIDFKGGQLIAQGTDNIRLADELRPLIEGAAKPTQ